MARNQSVLDIIIKTIKQGDGDKRVVSGLASVKSAGAAVMGAFAALAGTAYALNQAFDATVGTTVRLADEVRGIQQVSGLSAEEASRLIQITDDFKVSQEELMKVMQKNGDVYDYSTAGLAQMSDSYLALTDANEKADFMQERFGKNWGTFVELMEQGGDKIRAAGEGINEALIFDQAALDSAREYQMQVDQLSDSWMAYKVAIGQEVLPVMNTVLQGLNNQNEIQQIANQLLAEGTARNREEALSLAATAFEYGGLTEKSDQANAARMNGLASFYETQNAANAASTGLAGMGETAEEASAKYSSLIGMMQSLNNATAEQIKLTAFQQLQNDLQKSGNELTKEEAALLQQAGVEMGIFSQQSADNAAAIVELNSQLQEGIITLEEYIAKLEAIPPTVTTDLIINEPEVPIPGLPPNVESLGGAKIVRGAVDAPAGSSSGGSKRVNIYGNVTVYAQGSVTEALEELGA